MVTFLIPLLMPLFGKVPSGLVVNIEIFADSGEKTGSTAAFRANRQIEPCILYIFAEGAKVGNMSLEIRHAGNSFKFLHYGCFRATGNKFTLVDGQGAEGTAPKHPRCRVTEYRIIS